MLNEIFMKSAIDEARKAEKMGEVPIGCVIVRNGKIIAKAHNLREKKKNALYHAEVLAVHKACKKLRSWRLDACDAYATLEPCLMCGGALLNARISNIFFGAYDLNKNFPNEIYQKNSLNHSVHIQGGIFEEECSEMLSAFFGKKRKKL